MGQKHSLMYYNQETPTGTPRAMIHPMMRNWVLHVPSPSILQKRTKNDPAPNRFVDTKKVTP